MGDCRGRFRPRLPGREQPGAWDRRDRRNFVHPRTRRRGQWTSQIVRRRGSIVLEFDDFIHDGEGDDFAVFENGFLTIDGCFCELAFVEISTNGVDFADFEAETLNTAGPGNIDPTDYRNLAGKHPEDGSGPPYVGTGFDLNELADHPLVLSGDVNLGGIRFIRITDVVGDGSTFDAFDNPVYDPYPTAVGTGGFDLNAVGIINLPEPGSQVMMASGVLALVVLGRFRNGRDPRRFTPSIAR